MQNLVLLSDIGKNLSTFIPRVGSKPYQQLIMVVIFWNETATMLIKIWSENMEIQTCQHLECILKLWKH